MTPVKYTKLKPKGKHLDEDDREYLNYKKRCNSELESESVSSSY